MLLSLFLFLLLHILRHLLQPVVEVGARARVATAFVSWELLLIFFFGQALYFLVFRGDGWCNRIDGVLGKLHYFLKVLCLGHSFCIYASPSLYLSQEVFSFDYVRHIILGHFLYLSLESDRLSWLCHVARSRSSHHSYVEK